MPEINFSIIPLVTDEKLQRRAVAFKVSKVSEIRRIGRIVEGLFEAYRSNIREIKIMINP